jgi:hypothetical protein
MPTKPKQNNILLMILIAVAALFALLLLLDTFLPILPDSLDRPETQEPTTDGVGIIGGEDTKKHWWEGIFDRDEPKETEPSDKTPENTEPVTRPYPTESMYYTSGEMTDAYLSYLQDALRVLGEMEDVGELPPIDRVGLFNLDLHGMPEIILRHKTEDGYYRYMAVELISLETILSWDGDTGETEELQAYAKDGGYTVLLTTQGDGDDLYVYEIVYDGEVQVAERAVKVCEGAKTTFYVDGAKTDEAVYSHTYGVLVRDGKMPLTELKMLSWDGRADPDAQANHLLSTGQRFIRTEQTLP